MNNTRSVIPTNSGGWVVDHTGGPDRSPIIRQGMLDELLRGGLVLPPPDKSPDGLIVMLCGKAGTGKSTLALQLAANVTFAAGQPKRHFFSLEQDGDELRSIYRRLVTDQCRQKWELLRAVNSGATIEQVAVEYLTVLGVDAADTKLKKTAIEVLKNGGDISEKRSDKNGETVLPRPNLIEFAGEVTAEYHLREDPLARAHGFVDGILKGAEDKKRAERPILFLDGLSILSLEKRGRLELADLIRKLRQCCLLAVIAYEPSRGIEESIDHQVDLVIELEEKHVKTPIDYVLHELHFKKSRYQEAALGWHQYKIRGCGLEIYPSVHFQVHSHLYMASQWTESLHAVRPKPKPRTGKSTRNQQSGTAADPNEIQTEWGWSVIEQVLGGVKLGDSIALLGPRGTFKTTLTRDFLFRSRSHTEPEHGPSPEDACSPEPGQSMNFQTAQHGLLVSVIDNKYTLRVHEKCPLGRRPKDRCPGFAACCGHVFVFYQRPGAIAPPEFLHYLKTRLQVANPPIRRLAFWDLTQLEHRFPLLANDPMFVPALLDLFKVKLAPPAPPQAETPAPDRRVKSVFMGAANARLSGMIAAVADNVLFCWRDRLKRGSTDKGEKTNLIDRIWKETEETEERSDYLMIYVDRTSVGFSEEKKNLFAFPVLRGARLFVPRGSWTLGNYAINSEQTRLFEQAEGQILHVTKMQGFSGTVADGDTAAEHAGNQAGGVQPIPLPNPVSPAT